MPESKLRTNGGSGNIAQRLGHAVMPLVLMAFLFIREAYGAPVVLDLMPALDQVRLVLSQLGPAISAVLFITAGIFYAVGQLLPPEKKAHFHMTAVNVVIGAVVVGALSVASSSLAIASTHLLSNLTANGTAGGG